MLPSISLPTLRRADCARTLALQDCMRLCLLAQAKTLDQRPVLFDFGSFQVIQQFAARADHPQQTAAGMMILAVRFKVISQIRDSRGQQRNLDFGRTRVALGTLEILQNLCLLGSGYSLVFYLRRKIALFYLVTTGLLKPFGL